MKACLFFWSLCLGLMSSLNGQETLKKHVISGGGGISISVDKAIQLTVGQPVIGWSVHDTLGAILGFWHLKIDSIKSFMTAVARNTKDHPELSQNFPNPFRDRTSFDLYLPRTERVKISVYNIHGQLLKIIVNRRMGPGSYNLYWDASTVAPGQYLYELAAGDYKMTRSMIIVR